MTSPKRLSEPSVLLDWKSLMQFSIQQNERQAFCVPKGLARSRATEGRRNGINGTRLRGVGGLCRIRFTLDRIKASPEATGRALRESNAVALATHGTIAMPRMAPFRGVAGCPRRGL